MKQLMIITTFILLSTSSFAQTALEIDTKLRESFAQQSSQPLEDQLKGVESPYWQAYNYYKQAIFYSKTKQLEQSERAIQKGKDILFGIENKNSEDWTLLAALQSFSMQFYEMHEMLQQDQNFYTYVEKAMKLDASNPRIYVIAGIYDYHKPVFYGGGQKAKEYLEKSLLLFKDSSSDNYQWGQNEAESYLKKIQ